MRVDGANNTKLLRELDFELLIAPDANGDAQGMLYLDDGESIKPNATSEISFAYSGANGTLTVDGTFDYQTSSKIASVIVLGGGSDYAAASDSRAGSPSTLGRSLTEAFTVSVS